MPETWVWSLGREDPLVEGMATHSSILAWEISQTEEPNGPLGHKRVGHNLATKQQQQRFDIGHSLSLKTSEQCLTQL